VTGEERDHLRAGLQDRHVGVEVDPVQALDVQRGMPVEEFAGCQNLLAHGWPPAHRRRSQDATSER
jgi:hypothetical protein